MIHTNGLLTLVETNISYRQLRFPRDSSNKLGFMLFIVAFRWLNGIDLSMRTSYEFEHAKVKPLKNINPIVRLYDANAEVFAQG